MKREKKVLKAIFGSAVRASGFICTARGVNAIGCGCGCGQQTGGGQGGGRTERGKQNKRRGRGPRGTVGTAEKKM